MRVGVVVGRFQVPQLTEGHQALLDYAKANSDILIVFVGSVNKPPSHNNPLTFEQRREKIHEPIVLPLPDRYSNSEWSRHLDGIIYGMLPHAEVSLFGGRDSGALKYYCGTFKKVEFRAIKDFVNATSVREEIARMSPIYADARSVIWATQQQHPKVYPTVDIALFDEAGYLYLGRKKGQNGWRFPGGFVEPSDASFLDAAKRELREECGDIEVSAPMYLGSTKIDDWRYRGEKDKIITTFFYTRKLWGRITAGDDLSEIKGFNFPGCKDDIVAEHIPLYEMLEGYYSSGKLPRYPELKRTDS